jgi:hypothetical protein
VAPDQVTYYRGQFLTNHSGDDFTEECEVGSELAIDTAASLG